MVLLVASLGCNKLWGVDDLRYGQAGDGNVGAAGGVGASSTGGGGTGGSGLVGGNGGSGGTSGGESCLNGIDDDGDELVDCDDPNCDAGFACAAPAPADWSGPGWVAMDPNTSCPGSFPTAADLHTANGLNPADATCGCSCDAPTGVRCIMSTRCWVSPQCGGAGDVWGHGCRDTCGWFALDAQYQNQDLNCSAPPAGATFGSCAANPQVDAAPVAWPAAARACLGTGDGAGVCDVDSLCVPRPAFDAFGPCIVRDGAHMCQPPYTTDATSYFDGTYEDTRSCSACTCGDPQGGTCQCQSPPCGVHLHYGTSCGGTGDAWLPEGGSCDTINTSFSNLAIIHVGSVLTNPGSCAPNQPTPTGAVTPTGTRTVCCMP